MNLRDRARRRMMGKVARLANEDDLNIPNGFKPGLVIDVDYEHVIHPERPPRDDPDSKLVVKLSYGPGDHGAYWYHAYWGGWQVFGESELIDPYNP